VVSDQQDLILNQVIERSQGGFILNPNAGFGPNQHAFGHNGAGGSSAFADPESGVAFAYVMNQMQPAQTQPRAPKLAEVFFNCL
jgi:CubicO group peptidase (beta-lactamase class C family)